MTTDRDEHLLLLAGGQPPPDPEEEEKERDDAEQHAPTIAVRLGVEPGARARVDCATADPMRNLEEEVLDTESLFARAIREHLDLKSRNSGLESDMPLDPYLDGDTFENHPLFKSEEQARIEETLDGGERAVELSSERLPWPGEDSEESESAEGAALDETLWTGRPRDFDWGD